MAFTLPSLKSALKKTNNDIRPCNIQGNFDMPEFKFNELADKEVIGHGSYGIVYKTSYLGKTVVVKNIEVYTARLNCRAGYATTHVYEDELQLRRKGNSFAILECIFV